MNKISSDSALLPHCLPVAGWGHALAQIGEGKEVPQSLPAIIASLPVDAVHEVFASTRADIATMTGFAMMLALMLARDPPYFIVRPAQHDRAMLYPLGLAALGLDPDHCFNVYAPDLLSALRATADIVRSNAAGAVLIEVDGNPRLLDLTATRRLALAAEKSGTAVLLLRNGAREAPSAAYSRWEVTSAPSPPLAADAPGGPAFDVTLLRHRRVQAGLMGRLAWNNEERRFDEQPIITAPQREGAEGTAASGRVLPLAARRAAGSRTHRAA